MFAGGLRSGLCKTSLVGGKVGGSLAHKRRIVTLGGCLLARAVEDGVENKGEWKSADQPNLFVRPF